MLTSYPPYLPKNTEEIESSEWLLALNIWNANLTEILRSSDSEFRESFENNETLWRFLESFLRYNSSSTGNLAALSSDQSWLLKKVFLVLLRAIELNIKSLLYNPSDLMNFVALYGRANAAPTKKALENLLHNSPQLLDEFGKVADIISKFLQSLVPSEKLSSFVSISPTEFDKQLQVILDLAVTLDSLFYCSYPIARMFEQHHDFIPAILETYDYTLAHLTKSLPKGDISAEKAIVATKMALIYMLNSLFDARFFIPLGFESRENDPRVMDKLPPNSVSSYVEIGDREALIDHLNDTLMHLLEISNLDGHFFSIKNAPILMDFEVECNLSGKIRTVMAEALSQNEDVTRLEYVVMSLEQVRDMDENYEMRQRRIENRAQSKGEKERKKEVNSAPNNQWSAAEEYIHRSSLISQIQDLFPDLGEGYIEACLRYYHDNMEEVVMHLLENNMPSELASMDKSIPRIPLEEKHLSTVMIDRADLNIEDSPLTSRHNIFDNDEFDIFSGKVVDPSRVIMGKKSRGTANGLLNDKSFVNDYKKAIIERAYNMYDDEYDDSYDDIVTSLTDLKMVDELEDHVKSASTDETVDPAITHESDLIQLVVNDPSVLERSATARKSAKRIQLRQATKMSNEQIEGWYIMFQKNPRKEKLIEKYAWDGRQTQILRTDVENEESGSDDGGEPSSGHSDLQQRQKHDQLQRTSAQTRLYKEKNKSKFANHQRKQQHDKKFMQSVQGGR